MKETAMQGKLKNGSVTINDPAGSGRRDPAIDVLRCLAILLVLSLHSLRYAVPLANGADPGLVSASQLLASAIVGLSTLGVPLFIMITGYLLLHREYTKEYMHRFLRRNVLPLLIAFEIWNALTAVVHYNLYNECRFYRLVKIRVIPWSCAHGTYVVSASNCWSIPYFAVTCCDAAMVQA
ncbi:acyltransferase [Bifidobacterium sp. LC6]|uniref:Acyltransferase n=1 Tax=Bifidobacterium colobi TaxID=2809026 RepID=A0ABS5UY94_9BIFI|nr:acyltransferase [Bifidobacterium colobi]